jgi:acyl phosphate:glycerol-3-phosphate acyltransferase
MTFIALLLIAYLLGSLSSGIIFCKLMGLPDPRSQGSGNPGATNVLRMAGKKLGVTVLLGDIIKGVVPVVLAKLLHLPPHLLGWIVLAAFIGHLLPIFFGFKGGKGVATAIGGVLVLCWPLALALIATFLLVVVITRYVSLAAIIAALLAMGYGFWLLPAGQYLSVIIMCLLLVVRHYENIQRLLTGKENKIGKKPINVA